MSRPLQRLAVMVLMTVAVVACTSPDRPSVQGDTVTLPTPMQSFDASLSVTLGQLESAATTAGSRLETAASAYRPSEPQSLLQVPRVVMRADLADPDDGYLIVYQAADAGTAGQLAEELADYLGSGFGQTNYAAGTQFSVAVLGDSVVFTTWSPGRSSDPERARAVFDALAAVGRPIEVLK